MAKRLSAKDRLQLGIDRIKKTGWCVGDLRCSRQPGAKLYDYTKGKWVYDKQKVSTSSVCLLGSLITDEEFIAQAGDSDRIYGARLPGLKGAAKAVIAQIPEKYRRDHIVSSDSLGDQIYGWNDDNYKGVKTKARALRTLRKALEILEE